MQYQSYSEYLQLFKKKKLHLGVSSASNPLSSLSSSSWESIQCPLLFRKVVHYENV